MPGPPQVLTIGHSTHASDRFTALLRSHRIELLGDVRRYPGSRRHPQFGAGLERLESLARKQRTAIMCAEGDWRRCHRRLISDALVVRGWRVAHIRPDGRSEEHVLTPFAFPTETGLIYPAGRQAPLDIAD